MISPVNIIKQRADCFILNAANGAFLATCTNEKVADMLAKAISEFADLAYLDYNDSVILAAAEHAIGKANP